MSDTAGLIAKARALGEALAAHQTVQAYHAARRQARADADAQRTLRDYQAQLDRVRDLEQRQQPVEVADKHKLRDLEARMAGNAALKDLMRAQTEYVALMAQINRAMDEPLAALSQPEHDA